MTARMRPIPDESIPDQSIPAHSDVITVLLLDCSNFGQGNGDVQKHILSSVCASFADLSQVKFSLHTASRQEITRKSAGSKIGRKTSDHRDYV